MTIRNASRVSLVAALLCSAVTAPASAEERPACPTGVQDGWAYHVTVDSIRLEDRDAPVAWDMADGSTETTKGYAVGYSWSAPYEGQSERIMDDGQNLQLGVYVLHPPQREMQYGKTAFSRTETDDRHDTEEALKIDGETVLPQNDDGWNPQRSTSVYLGALSKEPAEKIKAALDAGGHSFTVDLWFNRDIEYGTSVPYGSASFTVPSVTAAIDALRPVMAGEKARQKETGIWCLPAPF